MRKPKAGTNPKWVPSVTSFEAMLEWLDDGVSSEGRTYNAIRERLVTYFIRKGCSLADDLADETLNRVQRRLEEESTIDTDSPAKFCYTIARYVFLEDLRSGHRREVSIEHDERQIDIPDTSSDMERLNERLDKERALDCLESCAAELDPPRRAMIVAYYNGRQREKIENRREMAEKLGLSMNALAIRAFRVRAKLERCVKGCLEKAK